MLGVGEILAITSLAIQVVAAVDKVILIFDRAQNAPDELRRFQSSVSRLQTYAKQLEKQLEISGPLVDAPSGLDEIEETLDLCKALFEKYETGQGSTRTPLRAIWSPRESTKLDKYQKRIDSHFSQIILPLWMAALSAQWKSSMTHLSQDAPQEEQTTQAQQQQRSQPQMDASISTTDIRGSVISEEDIKELDERISELRSVRSSDDRAVAENIRQKLDQSLLNCWLKLGLTVEEDELFTAVPAATRRMSTQAFETAPTTITLEGAPEQHRKLELERIHVMARDDKTRILRYYSNDMSIKLTHIIPYGSIPWTRSKHSKSVCFLTPHTITVIDHGVYHIYNLVPKYRFHSPEHCRTFQETFRERDYLGDPHEAVQIVSGGDLLACRQVIKFWRKVDTKQVTLTFLASSFEDDSSHWELNVQDFLPEAVYVTSRMSRRAESNEVKIRSKRVEPSIHFKFESVDDATAFKDMYKLVHPFNAPAPRLGIPEATSSSASSNISMAHGTISPSSTRADSFLAEWEEATRKKSIEQ